VMSVFPFFSFLFFCADLFFLANPSPRPRRSGPVTNLSPFGAPFLSIQRQASRPVRRKKPVCVFNCVSGGLSWFSGRNSLILFRSQIYRRVFTKFFVALFAKNLNLTPPWRPWQIIPCRLLVPESSPSCFRITCKHLPPLGRAEEISLASFRLFGAVRFIVAVRVLISFN